MCRACIACISKYDINDDRTFFRNPFVNRQLLPSLVGPTLTSEYWIKNRVLLRLLKRTKKTSKKNKRLAAARQLNPRNPTKNKKTTELKYVSLYVFSFNCNILSRVRVVVMYYYCYNYFEFPYGTRGV